ncbi:domain found in IF2B/IF5-domain-containing protein [Phialemonium atrogriseum]|uniref:Domain found in IF2B/IF5-domain-containing protein n=1 Tax=Phialemonium atrogriseum TaxID=1093897 RepID=A0AAJ0FKQ8_9PEZI|nr:domain found in IF2B/IF5-domain-containing protein [Phialemonium atrogriseum]KAK1771327.1 domain found in IF2B/IF5-domain-containing protein [Phialemonium atrogriseum]
MEENLVVDVDGSVAVVSAPNDGSNDSAQSHTLLAEAADDDELDELDLSLLKKKKKKAKKAEESGAVGSDGEAPAGGEDEAIDLTMMKKKKKKKAPISDDDFAKKLEALNVEGNDEEEEAVDEQEGDSEKGTGIWKHSEVKPIKYDLLLSRFFELLAEKNPDHALSGSRSYKIPPPQCMREGNKKTIFANIPEICKRMKRTDEHVTAYLFAELGTTGSVDGSRRLVIKGRFQQKQIENVLRKYIIEYVTCRTCRSPDTELVRGENRLYFVTCNTCGSRRSVQAIRTGFSAQVGKRKKMRA